MAKLLILFAHPALEKSRIHKGMIRHISQIENVTMHDLYEEYPDFDIDVTKEQKLLLQHDVIIWQHPFYWYSAPAIIKQWMDLVLEHGWAYGENGKMLQKKKVFNAISCGGSKEVYSQTGRNRFSISQFLVPFDQTAALCGMLYLPPFVVHGTHRLEKGDIELYSLQYEQLITAFTNDRIQEEEWKSVTYLNELCPIPESIKS